MQECLLCSSGNLGCDSSTSFILFGRDNDNRALLPCFSPRQKQSACHIVLQHTQPRYQGAISITVLDDSNKFLCRTSLQRHSLINRINRIDREFALSAGFDDIFTQHQVLHVSSGNCDTLRARKTPCEAQIEEALNLFVHTADCLNLAMLVD